MNQLVYIENGRAVTDSLTVAEKFGKDHDKVMRDIRELECSTGFSLANFGESTYANERGRTYPKYIITHDGFSFLVMGYTGRDAASFKEMYITQFNQMREQLQKQPVLSERQAVIQSLKLTAEIAEEIDVIKDITHVHQSKLLELEHKVDEQITLEQGEQRRVQIAISTRIFDIETESQARSPLFRELHRELKNRWGVSSYRDLLRKDILSVLAYINAWVPRKA